MPKTRFKQTALAALDSYKLGHRDGNILLDENFETIRARVAEGL